GRDDRRAGMREPPVDSRDHTTRSRTRRHDVRARHAFGVGAPFRAYARVQVQESHVRPFRASLRLSVPASSQLFGGHPAMFASADSGSPERTTSLSDTMATALC